METFPWTRFVYEYGAVPVLEQEGYWPDASRPDLMFLGDAERTVDAALAAPCAILLGEAGMGKTFEFVRRSAVEAETNPDGRVICRNLGEYGSPDEFARDLFDSQDFTAWKLGDATLYLYLDNLDGGLARIDTLGFTISRYIGRLSRAERDRLRLRIACRATDWPETLGLELARLWDDGTTATVVLAPLRRADVRLACSARGIDATKFFEAVSARDVGPLAARPITLQALLDTFADQGAVPNNRTELYHDACLRLSRTLESHDGSRPNPALTAHQRLAVASRIAALLVFGNKIGVSLSGNESAFLSIETIVGGQETAEELAFEITRLSVEETLRSGLFTSAGSRRYAFVHASYAEYLAAEYLRKHKLSTETIMELLLFQPDASQSSVPQLRSVASWIASLLPETLPTLLAADVEVVLGCDEAALTRELKQCALTALLNMVDAAGYPRWMSRPDYLRKLVYDEIESQLVPVLADQTAQPTGRVLAIEVAEAGHITSLSPTLVRLALDPAEPLIVRKYAAYAVANLGEDSVTRLKPLLGCSDAEDPDSELRGVALRALYPDHLGGDEVFRVLSSAPLWNGLNAFTGFLYELPNHLRPDDLAAALDWTTRLESSHRLDFTIQRLLGGVFERSWQAIPSRPDLVQPFCRAVLARAAHFESIGSKGADIGFSKPAEAGSEKVRHALVDSLLSLDWPDGVDAIRIMLTAPFLFPVEDRDWLIQQLLSGDSEELRSRWADVLGFMFARLSSDFSDFEVMWDACQRSPALAARFALLFEPVEIDSEKANAAREQMRERMELEERTRRQALDPPPQERVLATLHRCEESSAWWWQLTRDLSLDALDTHYQDGFRVDVREFVGWKTADSDLRGRVTAAARRFLEEQDCQPDSWVATNTVASMAIAGYRALVLLSKEEPEWLESREAGFWDRWAEAVVAHPAWREDSDIGAPLVRYAFAHALHRCIRALVTRITCEDGENGTVTCLQRVEGFCSSALARELSSLCLSGNLTPGGTSAVLSALFQQDRALGRSAAVHLIGAMHESDDARLRALVAAQLGLSECGDDFWDTVWPLVESDDAFGAALIERAADSRWQFAFGDNLTGTQLGQLVEWLFTHFPPASDPTIDGAHMVSTREQIGQLRDSLVGRLRDMGSAESLQALRKLVDCHPEYAHLGRVLSSAEVVSRAKKWTPLTPSEFLRLVREDTARFVEGEAELARLVIKSLRSFQEELQGEDEGVRALWNTVRGDYRPKAERDLSQRIRTHLQRQLGGRGVVVNREVEVGHVSELDLKVDAISSRGSAPLTVVVEVKGCWNRDLFTAMKDQLTERYLPESGSSQGIYVVGRFLCDKWTDKDHRKRTAKSNNRKGFQRVLETRREELSTVDRTLSFLCLDLRIERQNTGHVVRGRLNRREPRGGHRR